MKMNLEKEFFIEYGKVLYALTSIDGEVQEIEKDSLLEEIKPELEPLEGASERNMVYYTLYPIESPEYAPRSRDDAINSFLQYLRKEDIHLSQEQTDALTRALQVVAEAHDYVEPEEQHFIDLFDTKLSAAMEVERDK